MRCKDYTIFIVGTILFIILVEGSEKLRVLKKIHIRVYDASFSLFLRFDRNRKIKSVIEACLINGDYFVLFRSKIKLVISVDTYSIIH